MSIEGMSDLLDDSSSSSFTVEMATDTANAVPTVLPFSVIDIIATKSVHEQSKENVTRIYVMANTMRCVHSKATRAWSTVQTLKCVQTPLLMNDEDSKHSFSVDRADRPVVTTSDFVVVDANTIRNASGTFFTCTFTQVDLKQAFNGSTSGTSMMEYLVCKNYTAPLRRNEDLEFIEVPTWLFALITEQHQKHMAVLD